MSDLARIEPQEIQQFDPAKTKERSSVITAAINHAQRMRDWEALRKAVQLQIKEQQAFVAWWKASVRNRGNQPKVSTTANIEMAQAQKDTGISFWQVSRWAQRLEDPKNYENQLFGAAYRAAMTVKEDYEKPELLPPVGKYSTVVLDPPWPIQKIERDAAPHQIGFDYPIMTEEEIIAFPIKECFADDCHVFVWTTQKFLPFTFEIVAAWGVKYVLTMVWHKPGGFQPFELPQYNCEFVVYGRYGSPKFSDTKQFDCCFSAPRREHSRKPDEFYDLIKRVTAEPRLDVFSREPRNGFDQYGNESEKFAVSV